MEKQHHSKKHINSIVFSVIVFILVALAAGRFLLQYMSFPPDAPIIDVEMNRVPSGLGTPAAKGEVLFAGELKGNIPDAYLQVNAHFQHLKIYIGNELVFETPDAEQNEELGSALYFVPIGSNYNNKPIQIVSSSTFFVYAETLRKVHLGEETALREFSLAVSMPYVYLMIVCILCGMVFLLFAVISAINGHFQWPSFHLGMFSVVWGMFLISKLYITYEFFSPIAISNIGNSLNLLYPLFISSYLYCRFVYLKKWARYGLVILVATAAVAFFMRAMGLSFLAIVPLSAPINQILFVYIVLLGFIEAIKGNHFIRSLIPFSLLLLLSWILLISQYYIGIFSSYSIELAYNIGFFVLVAYIWLNTGREIFRQWQNSRLENKELHMHNYIIMQTYQAILQNNEYVRELKHEMQHQLAALQVLLAKGDTHDAQAFLSRLTTWRGLQNQWYCNCLLVNEIVADAELRAQRQGIQTTWKLDLPEILNLDVNALCSVLMNVLDNALQANSTVDKDLRYIKLSMHLELDCLFLECENAATQKAKRHGGIYRTSKPDAKNHGYGLRVIQKMVEENQGLIAIETEKTQFKIRLTLALK